MKTFEALPVAAGLIFAAGLSLAQNGLIQGTVTDESGKSVAWALVGDGELV
jgi:hypothetical protein